MICPVLKIIAHFAIIVKLNVNIYFFNFILKKHFTVDPLQCTLGWLSFDCYFLVQLSIALRVSPYPNNISISTKQKYAAAIFILYLRDAKISCPHFTMSLGVPERLQGKQVERHKYTAGISSHMR